MTILIAFIKEMLDNGGMKNRNPFLVLSLLAFLSACTVTQPTPSSSSSAPASSSESSSSSSSSSEEPQSSEESKEESTSSTQTIFSSESEESESSEESLSSSEASSDSEESLPAIDYVKVFVQSSYSHVWAWTDKGNIFSSSWPGEKLKDYDDNWKTYDFEDYTTLNIIFSEGGNNQTADLNIPHAGYWWWYQNQFHETNPLAGGGAASSSTDISIPEGSGAESVDGAKSYLNFPLWNEFEDDHWTTVSPYQGTRTDFRDESIYFAMTTRFYDGDSSNNARCWDGRNNSDSDPEWRGDFKGLIERMDYIKALGFTSIWITPVVKNASGYDYHGYHAINFSEVDSRYESEDVAFIDVIKAAHSRDMKIILDVVFNHTGNFGEENLYPMFYKSPTDHSINGIVQKDKSLLPSNYGSMNGNSQYGARIDSMKNTSKEGGHDDNLIYHHEKSMAYEQYIEQTGQMAGDCVDLNTENPTVCNYLVKAYGEFIRLGVDAFRIDTVKHISRLTFNNYLWPAFYHYAEKCGNNHFFMFGEVCTRVREVWNHGQACDSAPFYTWKESKNYAWGDTATNAASALQNWNDNANTNNQPTSQNAYLNNGAYHTPDHSRFSGCSVIDFPMHWNFQYARDAYNVAVNNDRYYNDATYNVVYVDSHDYGPDGIEKVRYNMGTSAWKENMSLMFTFRGVPCIYYGSEIEFQAGKTIDEGPNIALKDSGRAYFGDHLEGSVTATGFGQYTATGKVQQTLNHTLAKHLQTLNKIRLQVPALRRGQYRSFGDLQFVRRYTAGGIDSVAAVAISNGCTFTGLPNGNYKDMISGRTATVNNGSLSVSVSGQGNLAIYVKQ